MVFRWDAPLIFANADRFTDGLTDLLAGAEQAEALVLDCQAIDQIDTTGSAALVGIKLKLDKRGLRLCLARVHGPVRELLRRDGSLAALGHPRLHATVGGAVADALGDHGGPPPSGRTHEVG